ncbi:MAG: single-stranded DNA-binding protein [Candidatus Kerfeldbacteria bacterium]|nr:single-stranded DNA-binding protein [Candidatus Kerfeldbacteria bacterium]
MSFSLNRATIIGNLTRDPESRTTNTGQNVVSFGVATSRRWKDQASGEMKEATEFHNCVAWAKLAQTIATYCHKGSKVYVEGRLQTRSWDDPTGVKKYRTEIVADNLIMLDRKGDTSAAPPQAATKKEAPAEEEINIEDIPF